MKCRQKKILSVMLALIISALCVACTSNPVDNEIKEPPVPPKKDYYSYYPEFTLGKDLYYIKAGDMTDEEYTMISSLAGICTQNGKASIYIDARDADPAQSYAVWREHLQETKGLKFTYESDPFKLVEIFKNEIKDSGYVLYDQNTINGATVVSGVDRYLMSGQQISEKLQQMGFTKKYDCIAENVGIKKPYDEIIFEKYKDSLNKKLLFHQAPTKRQLRDYAIATRSFIFYVYDPVLGSAEGDFTRRVYDFTDRDIPILGWAEDELKFIDINSEYGKITIASDWSDNLSFLGAIKDIEQKQTKYEKNPVIPQKGKHYAAVVMSDGDNIQWYKGGFINNPLYYASPDKGAFALTYGISPSLADLAPSVMQKIYSAAASNEYFTAAVSGQGYINATEYANLDEFSSRTGDYMEKSDLDYVTFLDEGNLSDINASFFEKFAKSENIKGGMWMYGDKYAGGKGAVHWSNDKPLLAFRDGIWEEDSRRVATRVNSYTRDYTKIEGYSLINAHCWSTPYSLIKRFVDALDKDVVLVTADVLFDMITKNVPHENKVYLDDLDPYNAANFDYIQSELNAYKNQFKRLTSAPSGTLPQGSGLGVGYGVNKALGTFGGIKEGATEQDRAIVLSNSSLDTSNAISYALAKFESKKTAENKVLRFKVKGEGGALYNVKMLNALGVIETVSAYTAPQKDYAEISLQLPRTAAYVNMQIIFEIKGTGTIYIKDAGIY